MSSQQNFVNKKLACISSVNIMKTEARAKPGHNADTCSRDSGDAEIFCFRCRMTHWPAKACKDELPR